jgi:hypothetical protein
MNRYYPAKTYLDPKKDDDKELIDTLERISKKTGLNLSSVVHMILRLNAKKLESSIESVMKEDKEEK